MLHLMVNSSFICLFLSELFSPKSVSLALQLYVFPFFFSPFPLFSNSSVLFLPKEIIFVTRDKLSSSHQALV